jgi:CBS domain containing-hemolysin-like protein
MPSATVIRGMIIISYPLVWLSEWITKLVASKKQPLSVSREEVSAMVSVGTQEGVFDNSESQMIQSLFKLSSKTLYEIMTPRTVAITASANMKLKEFYANQMHRIYSRIPVYDDNPNFITGFVLKQTVLEELAEDKFNKQLKDIRRPILSYNEDKLVSEVWEEMLLKKEHIAQVQDEYGCFLGIVTMEDIIETIIGREIVDESDTIVDMQAYAREKWQRELKHKNKL